MHDFSALLKRAHEYDIRVRGVIGCAFGRTLDGETDDKQVIALVRQYLELGVEEIVLTDSHGLANPMQVQGMLGSILPFMGKIPVGLCRQNPRGMELANVFAALEVGVCRFDTTLSILRNHFPMNDSQGCIATEDVVHMLHEMSIHTGIDHAKLIHVSHRIDETFHRSLSNNLQPHKSSEHLLNGNLRD